MSQEHQHPKATSVGLEADEEEPRATSAAEEALRQSEERFSKIFDDAPIGMAVVDPDLQFRKANRAYCEMVGYTEEEMAQLGFEELNHPEDWKEDMKLSRKLYAREIPIYSIEKRYITKGGETVWVHKTATLINDSTGAQLYGLAMIENITERKLAQDALKRQKEILQKIFDHIPVMISFYGADGRIKLVNREWERVRGWTLKEIEEQSLDIVAESYPDPDDGERARDLIAKATGEWQDFKTRAKNGQVTDTTWAVTRLSDGTRLGIGQDITERKRAEEQLRDSNEKLRALSARLQSIREEESTRIAREIHDELGASLTRLRWDLESLDKAINECVGEAQRAQLHEKLATMVRLMDATVNTVRRIASELRPTILDDLGLLEAIEWQAQEFQTQTGIACRYHCLSEDPTLDRQQSTAVFRILQEALTNIRRHAQATVVDISAEIDGTEFVLIVGDNGRGITESEKSARRSLGILGMRERAHLIGGSISISGIEGEGTMITVRVPLRDRESCSANV